MLPLLLLACFPRVDTDDLADIPAAEAACGDGVDEDQDGVTDCGDPDCASAPLCGNDTGTPDSGDTGGDTQDTAPPGPETDCDDGRDDDGDGKVDCDDTDCDGASACVVECWDDDLGEALGASVASGAGSGDDGEGSCGGSNSVDTFFAWTAPASDTFVFDTVGSTADTTLWIAADTCDGAELACDTDTFGTSSQAEVTLSAGDTVVIGVEGSGSWVLNAWQGACPNYSIGSEDGVQGTTASATGFFETSCGDIESALSFRWIAPSRGTWTFSTQGSDFDTFLAVLADGCEGAELDCNDDAGQSYGPSEVSVALEAGDVVAVVLGGWGGDNGDYLLTIGPG